MGIKELHHGSATIPKTLSANTHQNNHHGSSPTRLLLDFAFQYHILVANNPGVSVFNHFAVVAHNHVGLTLAIHEGRMIKLHFAGRSRLNGGSCNDQSTGHQSAQIQLTKGSIFTRLRDVNQEDSDQSSIDSITSSKSKSKL